MFDSGVGGLSIYKALNEYIPNARYIYASDSKNFPYGSKAKEEVVSCVLTFVKALTSRYAVDVLVIACNTASTYALSTVRESFPGLEVIGVVPALKPAAADSKTKCIGLLATPGTVESAYTKALISEFCLGVAIKCIGSRQLVDIAEHKLRGNEVDVKNIQDIISPFFTAEQTPRVDRIVLGCTHFPWLKEELDAAAKWPVVWVDSSEAIARRLKEVLEKNRYNIDSSQQLPGSRNLAVFSQNDEWVKALQNVLLGMGLEVGIQPLEL